MRNLKIFSFLNFLENQIKKKSFILNIINQLKAEK